MKKALLIGFTFAVLLVSLSLTALADSHSEVQACSAFFASIGLPGFTDVCATCLTNSNPNGPFSGGTTGDAAACDCKFLQDAILGETLFDEAFGNFGGCLQAAHAAGVN